MGRIPAVYDADMAVGGFPSARLRCSNHFIRPFTRAARGVKRLVSCLCLFAFARLVAWYLDFSFEEKALRLHTDDGVQA